jgi:hypothetical protein
MRIIDPFVSASADGSNSRLRGEDPERAPHHRRDRRVLSHS